MKQPIYVPLQSLDGWKGLLAKPELHWKENYSAMLTAQAWYEAAGFPPSIATVLRAGGAPLDALTPLLVIPEHQVALPPAGGRPTQTDVWVLASHAQGLASISVEGKVRESFGPTMEEWLASATPGKGERLAYLKKLLCLESELLEGLRYQFLHRLASAIIEAKRFHATTAVCLVQSFDPQHTGFADYQNFAQLYGQQGEVGQLIRLFENDGITVYLGWVHQTVAAS